MSRGELGIGDRLETSRHELRSGGRVIAGRYPWEVGAENRVANVSGGEVPAEFDGCYLFVNLWTYCSEYIPRY